MAEHNGDDLYEDKFARVYAEIVRIDQLRATDADAEERLLNAIVLRLDQRMDGQETAVAAALAAAEKAVTAALAASDKAVGKAEAAQAKVNETQNEFRGQLKDQASLFMPRAEAENVSRELRGLISQGANETSGLRSRIDVGPPSLSALQDKSNQETGRRAGTKDSRDTITWVLGGLVAVLAIVGAILALKPG